MCSVFLITNNYSIKHGRYIYFSWIECNNFASDAEKSPTTIWVIDAFSSVYLIPPVEITIRFSFSSSLKVNPLK